MSDDCINLPKAPMDLCFAETDFIQENFDVDTFLQLHRNSTKLETMRDDLGIYLKLLRSAMIDLINRDYADFVNLSSNLIGLDKAIIGLQIPLGQLREEVMQVQQALEDEITLISNNLENNLHIRERKQSLYSLVHVYRSITKLSSILSTKVTKNNSSIIDTLEQAAAEYNQLKFHMSRCKQDISSKDQQKSIEFGDTLSKYLGNLFLQSINERDLTSLIRCLRIYVTLDKTAVAENLVRKEVINPLINDIITEENLQSDVFGLQSIYQKLLNILTLELKQLLDVTLYPERTSVKGFNFLLHGFWIEVEEKIEQHIKSVFAPGNPELFHRRYSETLRFLARLEEMYGTSEALAALKNHPRYKDFLNKWNLPVYYQIRFQEIAGTIETILKEPLSPAIIKGTTDSLLSENFALDSTNVVWNCLLKIWSDDIFLYELFQRFWKFSLQICSRYQTWCQEAIKEVWPIVNETNSANDIKGSSKLSFLVHLYKDVEKFVGRLPTFLQLVQSQLKEEHCTAFSILEDCLNETIKSLEDTLPRITEVIVSELSKECTAHLKQVNDIPRLFRRTNRDVPTKPCAYVKNSLTSLINFHADYVLIIPENVNCWMESALTFLTENYIKCVTDVLTSVQKTEESLRRLKKIRDKSTGVLPPECPGVTDDEKIRTQLQVDVHGYVGMIKDLGMVPERIPHLQELIEAVEAAIKK